ncbi:dihydrolipoamide acetyltransferase family protein [Thermoactinomyces sp. DSM 45892]|uniref:dihydrolipoamide acetyltransferase family protein n=1 Tax=Thermoactinomyces sp. DSM 45892 TaxID=1882753 RepID=UPI00089433ED|nr:dihydrolipoamide acetyltransferase family protein [Thermoactinomyces sp. DSM 45892]SDZ36522.1 pyruvate dehydrogenase E2 component (dihydrolipoamide acetyltransferase) [Thermoactinomyces sp. DSM 45892]
MIPFRLPDIGEGVTEAEIVKWLVREGEIVSQDQAVVEVQTDKAVVELPSPQEGRVCQLYGQENEIVKVGEALFYIDAAIQQEQENDRYSTLETDIQEPFPLSGQTSIQPLSKKILASPAVRKRARQLGIDLTLLKGSGPRGRVLQSDLERQLNATSSPLQFTQAEELHDIPISSSSLPNSFSQMIHPFETEIIPIPLTPIRKVISRRLLLSTTTKPHATHFDQLDVSGLVRWRERATQLNGSKISYTAILLKMISCVLKKYPIWNSHFDEEEQIIYQHSSIHIGVATDAPQGLLVPVIKDIGQKKLDDISIELQDLTTLARSGGLGVNQMTGSTFTISNAGVLGGEWATPIIQSPEIGILAIHPIRQIPIVNESGELAVGWRMNVSLSFDHRIVDGADAIRFTEALQNFTQEPSRMLFMLT